MIYRELIVMLRCRPPGALASRKQSPRPSGVATRGEAAEKKIDRAAFEMSASDGDPEK